MTPAELAAIRERCDAASEGPWGICLGSGNNVCTGIHQSEVPLEEADYICDVCPDYLLDEGNALPRERELANMRFIEHARADIPALLGDNAKLEKRLDAIVRGAYEYLSDDDEDGRGHCPACYQMNERNLLGFKQCVTEGCPRHTLRLAIRKALAPETADAE